MSAIPSNDTAMARVAPRPLPPPNGLIRLLDMPMEVFDLIVREIPIPSLVSFSLTCHTARRVFRSHLRHVDWISFRRRLWQESINPAAMCAEFLQSLSRDLTDRYVYCHRCVRLHPFYDATTELSESFSPPNQHQFCRGRIYCAWFDTERQGVLNNASGKFSVTHRQILLARHHYFTGHGIDAQMNFGPLLEPPAIPMTRSQWKMVHDVPSTIEQQQEEPIAPPRWRRRIELFPVVAKGKWKVDERSSWILRLRHELVVPRGTTMKAARRYLDNAPYWICPHVHTHAIAAAPIATVPRRVDLSVQVAGGSREIYQNGLHWILHRRIREPESENATTWWVGEHPRQPPLSPQKQSSSRGTTQNPLKRCGWRVPGIDMATARAEELAAPGQHPPIDPVFGRRVDGWMKCHACQVAYWDVESRWNAEQLFTDEGGDETVCFALTARYQVY
ncbi:hypothetical protein PGQ11_001701 [Apiospora arundinis]|uniref:F-box domain-containing protein n=1 Tax=Apiospora arundinis TaxID=335852 RepID=A0ABR2JFQ4_9PEZI